MKGPKSTATVAQKKLIPETMKKKKADTNVTKKGKTSGKSSNAPKRPPSAFFIFMEEFRKEYKEKFPENKSAAVVAKDGGAKWKAMSDSEKAPYVEKAAKKKAEHGIAMKQFNDDLEKSESTSKSSSEIPDDGEQED